MLTLWIVASTVFLLLGIVSDAYSIAFLIFAVVVAYLFDHFRERQPWTEGLLLSLSSILIAVAISDGVLRIVLAETLHFRPHDRLFERSLTWSNGFRYTPNREVKQQAWGDLSNFNCSDKIREERAIALRSDGFGFRNDRTAEDSPLDLIALGDSFGVANGTTQSKTWWHLLSNRLGKKLYNLSMPASPREEVAIFERELPRLQLTPNATVLWLIFEGNDLSDTSEKEVVFEKLSVFEQAVIWLLNYRMRSPIKLLGASLFSDCETREKVVQRNLPEIGEVLFLKEYDAPNTSSTESIQASQGWRNIERSLDRMATLKSQHQFNVIVVSVPTKAQVHLDKEEGEDNRYAFAQLLDEESDKRGFSFVDLLKPLREISREQSDKLLYWRDDTHWNEQGNDAVARILEKEQELLTR